ncbi:Palmitoyltransferase ZDHHC3 (Acyltransferase ZDHHC3) (GABA-A receptor-associated membrane protein 1) (Golgi-specific DHHC zinc finger protein) (Zinc finger DHHC domain-containing protein 3) (DHHC-3) [Durusdinium trenchii]|uniref:Palmitoyltransferase ZDHHC3 (Acyltransferase ZDHHC3) (GABA-A receptor-associated membrane protein 1) (Golgi-specific DHHC zinc finger protein) (Zinc finger DHHC domain-containing protein 3) (DHHC-3) n=2 Tax=Durusdinium trenchii TaxID=1381693 RepID=A0ABP0J5N7_9DINO
MPLWWVQDPCGRNYVIIAQVLLASSGLFGATQAHCLSTAQSARSWASESISSWWLGLHEVTYVMAAWAHLACALSDPGAVPLGALEVLAPEGTSNESATVRWCGHCQVAKPPRAHHCSTCQRCIRKMDHHCMWMNNCIGGNNQKHFILFLSYTSLHCLGVVPVSLWCLFALHPPPGEEIPLYAAVSFGSVLSLLLAGCLGRYCLQLLKDQFHSLKKNQTFIEQLQGTMGETRALRATVQEVMGCAPSWRWLLPLPAKANLLHAWQRDGVFYGISAKGGALQLCTSAQLNSWRAVELGNLCSTLGPRRLTLSALVSGGSSGAFWIIAIGSEVFTLPLLLGQGDATFQEAKLLLPDGFGDARCARGLGTSSSPLVALGSSQGHVAWWSVADWRLLGRIPPVDAAGVLHLTRVWTRPGVDDPLTPEAFMVAVLDELGKCRLLDLSKGEVLCKIHGQSGLSFWDQPFLFISDSWGAWVSVATRDKVWTWDTTTGAFAHSRKPSGHEERMRKASINEVCWQAADGSAVWQMGEVILDGRWKLPDSQLQVLLLSIQRDLAWPCLEKCRMPPISKPDMGSIKLKPDEPDRLTRERPENERPPIDFDRIEGEKLVEKSLFKLRHATEPMIRSLKLEDTEPKVWKTEQLMSSVVAKSGFASFKLTEGKLPSIKDKLARRGSQSATSLTSLPSPGQSPTGLADSQSMTGSDFRNRRNFKDLARGMDADGNRLKRAEQYYQLLMRAKYKKDDADRKAAEAEELQRAEGAAKVAFRKLLGMMGETDKRSEGSTDSEAESDMDDDCGPLTAYDGQMKIDIDFVVVVPHREEKEEDVFHYPTHPEGLPEQSVVQPSGFDETPPASSSSGASTPLDFSDEMESLKVELKKAGKLEEPKGIAQKENAPTTDARGNAIHGEKTMPNVWDNPYPEWSLETGGSMYFIPNAERYAWCPSLPPPPPPSELGRRRLRLKPRLPLTLSNHRYKDEHPNIFPPEPFSPSEDHYASWEKKVLTYDLYKSCVESLAKMPPQEFAKDEYKHRLKFGSFMEKALGKSRAWKNWRSREDKRFKEEEREMQRERENEARRKLEKEKRLKAAEDALKLQEEDDDW